VSSLAETLKQGNSSDRLQALRTLQLFGPKSVEAVPALIGALADEKTAVRAQAAQALGNLGPAAEAAVPALTAMQEEGFVAAAVRKSLKKITGE
jgi:adenylate cyclase